MACVGCGRAIRPDEQEQLVQEFTPDGPTRSYMGCPDCWRKSQGLPESGPTVYTASPPPPGVEVCGICRTAFRLDNDSVIRLHPQDAEGDVTALGAPVVPVGQPSAQYMACPICVGKYRLKIAERLLATEPNFRAIVLNRYGFHAAEVAALEKAGVAYDFVVEKAVPYVDLCTGNWMQ